MGIRMPRAALLLLLALPLCSASAGLDGEPVGDVSPEAMVAGDECADGDGHCTLSVLQTRAGWSLAGAEALKAEGNGSLRAVEAPELNTTGVLTAGDGQSCLCIFDIDRTLTAKQGSSCPGSQKLSFWDNAYGGGPATLSALGNGGIPRTFCGSCYLGVVSAGDASGPGSPWRSYLANNVVMNAKQGELSAAFPAARSFTSGPIGRGDSVNSPLVASQPDGQKQLAVDAIIRWYKKLGVFIAPSQTFHFDDRASNVAPFGGSGFNAIQVSCSSRDMSMGGAVGLCGAALAEIRTAYGVHLC